MTIFICPNCKKPLTVGLSAWRCENGHAFDVGKSGDVNLLLPQQKRSKSPGDSKAMVTARRDFLASGVYQPIAELLAKYVTLLSQGMPAVIADAGCGEGYYLRQIQRLCYPHANAENFIGWDISKLAVQAAAKHSHPLFRWLTASNAAIPLADGSLDILLNVFGFAVAEEFARVLKPATAEQNPSGEASQHRVSTGQAGQGGYVISVEAGEQHLQELRRLIYPTLKPYREKAGLSTQYFTRQKQTAINYQVPLNSKQLQQLLLMTPHLYRASRQGKAAVAALTNLTVTVDVVLRIEQVKNAVSRWQ